jgi:guanylate kinase
MMVKKRQNTPLTRGNVIVISAPSGAGKSTLVKRLLASVPSLTFSVSHTTRLPRAGEKDGREYFFVTPARFKRMLAGREFVEWARVHDHLYGTSWRQLRDAQAMGDDILLDIDIQGHAQVRRRLPNALSVFVMPPSFRTLEHRLRRRHSEAPDVIEKRLAVAREEISHWREYDYLVVNDRLSRAVAALRAVVIGARFRRPCQQARAEKICQTFGG